MFKNSLVLIFAAGLSLFPTNAFVHATTTVSSSQKKLETAHEKVSTRQIKIKTSDGTLFEANLGYIKVPENRTKAASNLIKVAFMQILSPAAKKSPPVFHFHGGPDDDAHLSNKIPASVIENLNAPELVTIDFSFRSRGYREYLDFSDVVIMDDRGMGLSRPRLTCTQNPSPTDFLKAEKDQTTKIMKILENCRDEHTQKGVDLNGYSLPEIASDFNDLRKALGYSKATLQGTSFGSQTAFTIIQQYPQHVERAFLTGLEGLADTYDMPSEIQTATQKLIAYANANEDVRNQLPNGDLGYVLKTIMERLEKTPKTLALELPSGEQQDLVLDPRTVSQLLLSLGTLRYRGDTPNLGSTGAAGILPLILALYYEAYDGLAAVLSKKFTVASDDAVFNAAALSIDCSSGLSQERRSQFIEEAKLPVSEILFTPLGFEGLVRGKPDTFCKAFGVADMGDIWRQEKYSDIPVLLVHGNFDGTTPPQNAQRAIKRFQNGKLIMVEGAAHYKLEIEYLSPAFKNIRTEFVKTGSLPNSLPDTITLPPIKFEILPTPAVWAFKLGLGNTLLKITSF